MANKATLPKAVQEIAKEVAPSLVPDGLKLIPPPPKPKDELPPDLKQLVQDKKDYLTLARLIEEDMPWKAQQKEAEGKRKGIEIKIKNLLGKHKVGEAMLGDVRVSYYSGERSTIKADKLLAAGVPIQTIMACTEKSTSFTLRLSKREEKEGE